MKGRLQFYDRKKVKEGPYCTLQLMSRLAGVGRFYRNKLTLYLSLIKPHLIIISELSQEKTQKQLSVQVVRLSVKVFCLQSYTIILQSFSYISAKLEAAVWFYKFTGAHQKTTGRGKMAAFIYRPILWLSLMTGYEF